MMLKRIYSNASIKYKILVSFWVIILIVSTSLGLNSYVISQNSILERAYASNLEMVRQIDYNVQYVQNDFFDTLTLMSIDTKAQELLMGAQSLTDRQRENYATWESQRLNSIQTMINLLVAKRYVSRIALYSNAIDQPISYIDKEGLSLETKEIKPFSELIRSDEYSQIIDANGRIVWFALSPGHTFFNVRTEAQQIVAARLVKELNTQKSVGILLVASDEILFEKTYSPLIMTENASVTIIDNEGKLISCNGAPFYEYIMQDSGLINRIKQGSINEIIATPRGTQLITSYSENDAGWIIIYSVPYDNILGEITSIKWVTLCIIALCLLLSIPITLLIFQPISNSIRQLLESMNRFKKGDFETAIELQNNDELGELANGYNAMTREIKSLIDKVYVSQIREKEAELNALQAQINPHFLYNTLETIMFKAESKKNDEIVEMIYSLSRLFRLCLNRGDHETTVANEKELIEHYLLLQKMRLKDRLQYQIDIDETILEIRIPKLIIQPFVENSIIHGISPKKDGGSIRVLGYREGRDIIFEVIDSGIGMPQQQYKELIYNLENKIEYETIHGGYALCNVYERLRLAYEMHGFRIDILSEENVGFSGKITLINMGR